MTEPMSDEAYRYSRDNAEAAQQIRQLRKPIEPSPGDLQSEISERIHREWCETVRVERIKGRLRMPPRGHWTEWSG